ncbi:MAG: mitochondrial fission ELM1 family protein [Rickettsiales bacterium]|nr:mitochondrial fission ELM1 family protein [Rickettsiales bacterium]
MIPVWALVDDRTGHTGQVLGVLGKLGLPYLLKRLEYNWKVHLPNRLVGASITTLDTSRSAPIQAPWPKLVIASGRRTIPVAKFIKQRSSETIVCYLMWPGSARDFDLIAVPQHDGDHKGANILTTLAPLHAVTPETLAAASEAWRPQFSHLPRPWVAVMLGGTTKHHHYQPDDWRELLVRARALAGAGTLLITSSRRTPIEALNQIEPLLAEGPHRLHRWDRDKDNPYLGFLGCADAVIVTGDSLSMCAEACVAGKPVYIYAPPNAMAEKHKRLHESLFRNDLARRADSDMTLHWKPVAPLDDAGRVASELKARFPQITN